MVRPFWRYYGGKFRSAPRYPEPSYGTIVEPFAGSAGYSLRYHTRQVVLVERYPVIAGIWKYLIAVSADEVRHIPLVDQIDDLPSWVPQEARWLVGFNLNNATTHPCKTLSSGLRRLRADGQSIQGWSERMRERVASQVDLIRHWRVIEGDYTDAPDVRATWFVDPPYNNAAGRRYCHSKVDYRVLGAWCRLRQGQTIVCENEGADWLPFEPFGHMKAANGRTSREVVWVGNPPA